MLVYVQVDPIDTLTSVTMNNHPANTAVTGSPFTGGALSHLGNGLWTVNVGSITGNWRWWGYNASVQMLAYGYSSSSFNLDTNGNTHSTDYAPWLDPPPQPAPAINVLASLYTTLRCGVDFQNVLNYVVPVDWTKIYFTVKDKALDADDQSIVQILLSNPGGGGDGLKFFNKRTATTAAWGNIVVGGSTVTANLKAAATVKMKPMDRGYVFDYRVIQASGVVPVIMDNGRLQVMDLATNAVS